MRPSVVSPALVLITSLITSSNALQALTNSPCASKCGNVLDKTSGEDDITCADSDFDSVSKAIVFKNCVSCQLSSKYVEPGSRQTDLQWGLYNLRYAVSWCLFGYPNNTNVQTTPCNTRTACGQLENSFEFDSLSPDAAAFGYCGLMDQDGVNKCTACLSHSDDVFPVNYVTALNAACQQQPIPGTTISIDGTVFSKTRTNITDPALETDTNSPGNNKSSGLPLGAKVGIAVGAITAFLVITGCCIVWNGKRRRRAILAKRQRESGFADWGGRLPTGRNPLGGQNPIAPYQSPPMHQDGGPSAGAFFDSPQSQRGLQPWATGQSDDNSPLGEKAYFSPYSSQYTSPVSAHDQIQVVGQEWPMDNKFHTKGFEAGRLQARSRSKDRKHAPPPAQDQIEMQNVPPVLLHPGNGRSGINGSNDEPWKGSAI